MRILRTDTAITDEAASNFVAGITIHIPIGSAIPPPLTLVHKADYTPGVPQFLLDGEGAIWSLCDDDSAERTAVKAGDRLEVVKFRNGNEVERAILG
ncbi:MULTISPECIES: hypothetical protein [Actinomadura]|uniref:Uncharacterized protein n=2 Tax=Actinomadura TaxID=1988 RepID=A0A7K1L8X5_9ACTN|nr:MULTISPECIES: hypothetical protein [Actinomadura]KAB2372053.1 hypothetical protein F9B16_30775 [Actinomadura montaniterrae]MUN40879.1 hypothetical protein [Actinomadura litoris]